MQYMKLSEYKQTFISKFKNRRLRKLEKESSKKMKEVEDEIKKLSDKEKMIMRAKKIANSKE